MKKIDWPFINKLLFYLIVFLFPVNLGYHFITKIAYVNGLLTDYLIPTIYLQDILVAVFVIINVKKIKIDPKSADKFIIWFLFILLLSVMFTHPVVSSLTAFLRLFFYVFFSFYIRSNLVFKEDFIKIVKVLSVSFILLCLLGLAQWFKQGSIFNNYLFFGEQPYSINTPGINRENFFGITKVPPYGTFSHPNVFAGILSIVLIWFLYFIEKSNTAKIAFFLGFIVVAVSISKSSYISLFIGILSFTYFNKKYVRRILAAIVFSIFILSMFMPYIPESLDLFDLQKTPSYYRRSDLIVSAYRLIADKPVFGHGIGASTYYIENALPGGSDMTYAQPPHNLAILLLLEGGFLAVLFFMLAFFQKFKDIVSSANPVLFATFLQILFLGSFDHYFFTIHQSSLLLWFIFGLI